MDETDGRDKAEAAKDEPAKAEPAKEEAAKAEPSKDDAAKAEPAKEEAAKAEPTKGEDEKAASDVEAKAEASSEADADDAAEADEKPASAPPPAPAKKMLPAASVDQAPTARGTVAGVIALVILLGGILMSVFLMRRNDAARQEQLAAQQKRRATEKKKEPPWQVGQKVPVSITVIPDDAQNLECFSEAEIKGKHCAWRSKEARWVAGDGGEPKAEGDAGDGADATEDKLLFRPYSTTARQKLIAAGLWSQLKAPLPTKRFTVKCTFEIDGKLEKPGVRFAKGKEFHEVKDAWFAGSVTNCTIVPPK